MRKQLLLAIGIIALALLLSVSGQARGGEVSDLDFLQLPDLLNILPSDGWTTTRNPDGTYVFMYPYLLEFNRLDGKHLKDWSFGVITAIQVEGILRVTTNDITNMMITGAEGHLNLPVLKPFIRIIFHNEERINFDFRFFPTAVLMDRRGILYVKELDVRCKVLSGPNLAAYLINDRCDNFAMRIPVSKPLKAPLPMMNSIIQKLR